MSSAAWTHPSSGVHPLAAGGVRTPLQLQLAAEHGGVRETSECGMCGQRETHVGESGESQVEVFDG